MESKSKQFRLLELYSGIGGMRYALELAEVRHEVIAAMDVNPVVNTVYHHNFGSSCHFQRNIQSLSDEELDKLKIDIITMSPPCQPFTRVGLKKDINDARTNSFLHILEVITELQNKPTYLLLENVKGFEVSLAHEALLEALKISGYRFQEFLLSPSNFSFPNSRLRYYIIAKLEPRKFSFPITNEILSEMPKQVADWKLHCKLCCQKIELNEDCQISHFLEDKTKEYFDGFLVPDNILLKYAKVFDIVHENSSHSCCFTKAYGRYALGTGSVFTPCSSIEVASVFEDITSTPDETMQLELLKKLRLRYFTPREVANLMGFPHTFSFPSSVSEKQMYKTLGNSINVFVVSSLMKLLFEGD